MITVRRAGVEDAPALLSLGRMMREESLIPYPEIDEDAFRGTVSLLGDGYLMVIAEDDGPIGMLTAMPSQYVFARVIYAIHDVFFVRPDKRGSRAAFLLVQMFEDWAQEIGATRGVLGVHTGLTMETTGRFYEKLGYRHIGGSFIKEFG